MVAERTKRTERAEHLRTTSKSSARRPTNEAELGINPDHYSIRAAGPPRLASTRTSTKTTLTSTKVSYQALRPGPKLPND
eukprot:200354-Amphidinium_carterae.2